MGTVQTDHSSEFITRLTKKLHEQDIAHKHGRVRKPNDNPHMGLNWQTPAEKLAQVVPRY